MRIDSIAQSHSMHTLQIEFQRENEATVYDQFSTRVLHPYPNYALLRAIPRSNIPPPPHATTPMRFDAAAKGMLATTKETNGFFAGFHCILPFSINYGIPVKKIKRQRSRSK